MTPGPDCSTGQQKSPLDSPMAPKPHPHPTHSLTSPALPKLGCYESSQRRGQLSTPVAWRLEDILKTSIGLSHQDRHEGKAAMEAEMATAVQPLAFDYSCLHNTDSDSSEFPPIFSTLEHMHKCLPSGTRVGQKLPLLAPFPPCSS